MTSTKAFLLVALIAGILGGSIIYETIKSVEHIKTQVLRVNNQR
jgi:hypothetical protein